MALKNLTKMIQNAQKENELQEQFLADLEMIIKVNNAKTSRKPSTYFKPSSIGGCLRNIVYQRIGKEQDPNDASVELIGMGESGTDRHERIQNHIMQMEKWEWVDVEKFLASRPQLETEVVSKKGNEYKCFNKKYELSFLTDGILRHKKTGQYVILEIKTEASFKYDKRFDADPKHKDQGTTYNLAFGINKVIFLYENRNFCNKKVFMVDITDKMRRKIMAIMLEADECVKAKKLPPKTENKKECKYCKYKSFCKKDEF